MTLTGPRQSGKSTLLKESFPDYEYISLEDLDIRLFAQNDPRGFIATYSDIYPYYIQTYVERDVRLMKNIEDLSKFIRFLKLCAGRIGQLLNLSSLANDCGIAVSTVQAWHALCWILRARHKFPRTFYEEGF